MKVKIEKVLLRKESFGREDKIDAQEVKVSMNVKIMTSKMKAGKNIIKVDIDLTGNGDGKQLFILLGEYIIYYNSDDEFNALTLDERGNKVFEEAYNIDLKNRFDTTLKKAGILDIVLPNV